ncbi:MAG: ceramidase [Schleiferiaceae bacterium]|jgi:hypothetical protein|nr:ceramidase [Schleiferiaceae bacterium]
MQLLSSLSLTKVSKERLGLFFICLIGVTTIVLFSLIGPIYQTEEYHKFSDQSTHFGITNFWNVISNLPFLVIGIYALLKLKINSEERLPYQVFFIGITLVGVGSAYYHLHPTSETLVWDRLPMTVGFMSLLTIIISDFANPKTARKLLLPFILIGMLTIIYWIQTGDLRPYAFIQFFPLLAIPITLLVFIPRYKRTYGYWWCLAAYVVAKLLEHFDHQVDSALMVMSGHPLKHLAIAVGIAVLLRMFLRSHQTSKND